MSCMQEVAWSSYASGTAREAEIFERRRKKKPPWEEEERGRKGNGGWERIRIDGRGVIAGGSDGESECKSIY